jgi:Putative phage metallopeptidase
MSTTFDEPDDELTALLATVMRIYRPTLHAAEVRVGIVVASNPNGDAVMHRGHPAFGCIKVLSPVDRLKKKYEAELKIDGDKYPDLRPRQLQALLFHELLHIDLKKWWETSILDDDGEPTGETTLHWESDDRGRPKLKGVTGDWSAGDGFARVCAVFGADAIEYENIAVCKDRADRARAEGDAHHVVAR